MGEKSIYFGTNKRVLAQLAKTGYERKNIILALTHPSTVAGTIRWSLASIAARAMELILVALNSATTLAELQPHLALVDQSQLRGSKQGEVAGLLY